MREVFVSLGSNKGDSNSYLDEAISKIKSKSIAVVAVSSKYRTEPWGKKDQNDFLNMVLKLETEKSPWELLDVFQKIEKELGKDIRQRWGERTIDIDMVFYADKIIYEKKIIIPHPRFHLRKFVLIPLCEISCEVVDPLSGKSIKQLIEAVDDITDVKMITC